MDRKVNYGPLDGLARHTIKPKLIVQHWDDLLRLAGSLKLGLVQASGLMRTLLTNERPTRLAQALAEAGRIVKTIYMVGFIGVLWNKTYFIIRKKIWSIALALAEIKADRGAFPPCCEDGGCGAASPRPGCGLHALTMNLEAATPSVCPRPSRAASCGRCAIRAKPTTTQASEERSLPRSAVPLLPRGHVLFSEHRDMAAAQAFFRSAQAVTGITPDRVTTDGHDSYPRAIRTELGQGVRHRTSAYLNNRLEQDHRGIKGRYRPWPRTSAVRWRWAAATPSRARSSASRS